MAIAVALANEPKLLLADEPTGELDSVTSDRVYALFQRLNREWGLTVCIVSHDPQIARHVQRVVAIRDGKLASETVRRRQNGQANTAAMSQADQFEELIVLDSAGRLQIPKSYREQLALKNRVEMQLTEKGLLIRPAQNLEETSSQGEIQIESDIRLERKTGAGGGPGRRGLLARFRRRKDGNDGC